MIVLTKEQLEDFIGFLNVLCREIKFNSVNVVDNKLNNVPPAKALEPNFKAILIEFIPSEVKVGVVTLRMHNDNLQSVVNINNLEFVEKDFLDGLVRVRFEICRILNPKAFDDWGC